jgi:elongation factor G
MTVLNPENGQTERITHLFLLRGKHRVEAEALHAGDIGVVAKLVSVHTGSTLCAENEMIVLPRMEFTEAVYARAIFPDKRGEEDKISSGMQRLVEEDPTLRFSHNSETHQMIVKGLGDQHLEIVLSRLAQFGVKARLEAPRIMYRETITKKITAEGKHRKQSGGHGQYGHVKIEFEPTSGDDLVFMERVFGGSVPKNYHPAVQKGLEEMMTGGILAGYRVVRLKATLYDGSYHDVDSSEMAFKMAAHLAFKELVNAGPVILEPIGHLEVSIGEDYTGDIIGDINKRRGQVLSIEPGKLTFDVPMNEMATYALDLRSMTGGRGSFTYTFARYEQAPPSVVEHVIAEARETATL